MMIKYNIDVIHVTEKNPALQRVDFNSKALLFGFPGESSEADRTAARSGGTGLPDTSQQGVHPRRLSSETFKEGLPAEDVLLG